MKRLRQIVFALAVLLASLLAIANRTAVTVSLDPFSPASETVRCQVPLFLVIFISMLGGILLGGLVVRLGRRKPVSAAAIEGKPGGPAHL